MSRIRNAFRCAGLPWLVRSRTMAPGRGFPVSLREPVFLRDRTMQSTDRPRIKICCIFSVDEAWTAIRAGASALGLVSAMPSGPGPIADELIAEIAARVPPGIATFLLTSATDA